MIKRFLQVLLGAFLGALGALLTLLWFVHQPNWIFVPISAGICAILTLVWGEHFLKWIGELFKALF